MGRFTGSWAQRPSRTASDVPLKPEVDPEHLNPTDNPGLAGTTALWQESAGAAPTLPASYTDEGFPSPVGGGGPIDSTPDDPMFGAGVGHAQTQAEASLVRGHLMSMDYGAYAAQEWNPTTDRDGAPRVAIISDTPGEGDSPQTLQLQRTGVGQPNDPHARVGKRQKRWWDRVIDMHRYGVEERPVYVRNAYDQPILPPVPGGTQLNSPYATQQWMGTPDRFVSAQVRRTPTQWDAPTDAGAEYDATGSAGSISLLGSWGL